MSDCDTYLLDSQEVIAEFGINSLEMAKDVCAVIDKRIEPTSHLIIDKYNVQGLLHDIISSDIDVDRMDYLLRDSHMCGVNYGLYDPDRILKSMCAYGRLDRNELRIGVRSSALGAVEDLLMSRYQMHGQIYGHKTNRACNAMLDRIRERLKMRKWSWYKGCKSLQELIIRFNQLDDYSFKEILRDRKNVGIKVKEIAEKLFVERKLVKRVYEERVLSKGLGTAKKRLEEAENKLKRAQTWFVRDLFENKGPDIRVSDYYLKVLEKSPEGYYKVKELKNCTTVVQYLPQREYILRIYSRGSDFRRAKSILGWPN